MADALVERRRGQLVTELKASGGRRVVDRRQLHLQPVLIVRDSCGSGLRATARTRHGVRERTARVDAIT
ncbi:hypothetical protein [Streptomyces sp. NPDC088812]|uniref:hypothetical protein n=1 Tax=Streptomyces sp. NPDC088812 TaxID=3365905 RepID=UPI003813FAFA